MENTSKALLLAASVLLSVLLFNLFLYVKDSISLFQDTKVANKLIEENKEYNAKFEAYNKSFMYGTDVMSVVNLAYDNNTRYYDTYPDDEQLASPYYVDIKISINAEQPLAKTEYYYVNGNLARSSDTPITIPRGELKLFGGAKTYDNMLTGSGSEELREIITTTTNGPTRERNKIRLHVNL